MIPTKGDPARPVALAVNAARTLGVLLIVVAVLVLAASGLIRSVGDSPLVLIVLAGVVGVYGVPGALFIVFAGQLKQRKSWAAIVLIVMGGLVALLSAVAVASGAVRMAAADPGDAAGALGPVVFAAAILASAVLLIVHAARSLASIRVFGQSPNAPIGFQPIMAQGSGAHRQAVPYDPPPSQHQQTGDEGRPGEPNIRV